MQDDILKLAYEVSSITENKISSIDSVVRQAHFLAIIIGAAPYPKNTNRRSASRRRISMSRLPMDFSSAGGKSSGT